MKLRAAFSLSAALLALACRPEPALALHAERPLSAMSFANHGAGGAAAER